MIPIIPSSISQHNDDHINCPARDRHHTRADSSSLIPLMKRYEAIINFYTVGENNPPSMFCGSITDARVKSPLTQPQRLEGRGKHLYKYLPIRSKRRYTHTLKIHYICHFCCSSHSNFGIGDLVVGATPVTLL